MLYTDWKCLKEELYLWNFECFTYKLIVLVKRQCHIDDSPLSHFALHKLLVTVNSHDLLYVNSSIAGTSNYWLCI